MKRSGIFKPSDARLVKRALRKQPQAFEPLVLRCQLDLGRRIELQDLRHLGRQALGPTIAATIASAK